MNYNDQMYDPSFGYDAVADLVGSSRNVPPMMWQQGKQRSSISFTTKGLQNAPGANNCFLNSAVQVSLLSHSARTTPVQKRSKYITSLSANKYS